jgi:hypothetical protein
MTRVRKTRNADACRTRASRTSVAPYQSRSTVIAVAIVSVMGCARSARREVRTSPLEYRWLASTNFPSSCPSALNDFTSRMPLTLSCSTLIISPWSSCSRR